MFSRYSTSSQLLALPCLGLLLSVLGVQAQQIDSPPSLLQCLPTRLNFGGGTPPYYIQALPAGDPSGQPYDTIGPLDTTSYTWIVNVPAGTGLTLAVRDSTGAVNYAAPVTVQAAGANGDTSCIGQHASSSSVIESSLSSSSASSSSASSAPSSSGSSTSTSSSSTASDSSGTTITSSSAGTSSASRTGRTSNDSAQSTMTMTKSDHDSAQEAGAQATSPSSSTSASGNDKRMVSSLLLGTAVMLGITFGLA